MSFSQHVICAYWYALQTFGRLVASLFRVDNSSLPTFSALFLLSCGDTAWYHIIRQTISCPFHDPFIQLRTPITSYTGVFKDEHPIFGGLDRPCSKSNH